MRKLRKLLRLLTHPLYRRGLAHGVGAAIEHTSFLTTAHFATVVDAGANRGQFALALRACQPGARILAFEPLPGPAAIFRKLFATDPDVSLFPVALGTVPGKQTIHISRRADSSSLLPIGPLQDQIFPGTAEAGTQIIEVSRLDDILAMTVLARPALLKIDVQGFELSVLEGAGACLADFDAVYSELSFLELYQGQALAHDVIAWLAARGLRLAGIYNMAHDRDGHAVQADFHFRRA